MYCNYNDSLSYEIIGTVIQVTKLPSHMCLERMLNTAEL
jgi:hypothetical protein